MLSLAAGCFCLVAAVACFVYGLSAPSPHVIERDKVTSVKIAEDGTYVTVFLKKEGTQWGEAIVINLENDIITRVDTRPPATPSPTPLYIDGKDVAR